MARHAVAKCAQTPAGIENSRVEALVGEHLPLVQQVLRQVAANLPRHVERAELCRAGELGLVEAAQRFEVSRGVPFEGFACQRIRGAMLDAIRATDWAPRSVRAKAREAERAEQQLAAELGRPPASHELASQMGVSCGDLAELRERVQRSVVLALDQTVYDLTDDSLTLGELVVDDKMFEPSEELESRELLAYLRDAVKLLPEKHRLVIIGYFLEGRTSAEMARFLGVTESRVSQLRSEALEMLKDALASQYGHDISRGDPSSLRERRRARYAAAVGEATPWQDRLGDQWRTASRAQAVV